MRLQLAISAFLALAALVCVAIAVTQERRMHRHRQPGITYADATLRVDGGWRRADLFTPAGLRHQRRASLWGVTGGVLLLASLLAWVILGSR